MQTRKSWIELETKFWIFNVQCSKQILTKVLSYIETLKQIDIWVYNGKKESKKNKGKDIFLVLLHQDTYRRYWIRMIEVT